MLQVIHRMTTNLWENLELPNSWENSRLKALWNGKGSKNNPGKYRGLCIGSIVCKLINIIINRLRLWYEAQLLDKQNGFRKNRGTTMAYTRYQVSPADHEPEKNSHYFLLFFYFECSIRPHSPIVVISTPSNCGFQQIRVTNLLPLCMVTRLLRMRKLTSKQLQV